VTNPDRQLEAIWKIGEDMVAQVEYLKSLGKIVEGKKA
jgi:hypothetical protein